MTKQPLQGGGERGHPPSPGELERIISLSFHFVLKKKGTAAPPKEGRRRQHHPKEAEGGTTAVEGGRSSPLLLGAPSFSWTLVLFSIRPLGGAAFLCLLLRGAAWPPPPFGRAAFLRLFLGGAGSQEKTGPAQRAQRRTYHYPMEGKDGSTTQRRKRPSSNPTEDRDEIIHTQTRRRKAAPLKRRGEKATPPKVGSGAFPPLPFGWCCFPQHPKSSSVR